MKRIVLAVLIVLLSATFLYAVLPLGVEFNQSLKLVKNNVQKVKGVVTNYSFNEFNLEWHVVSKGNNRYKFGFHESKLVLIVVEYDQVDNFYSDFRILAKKNRFVKAQELCTPYWYLKEFICKRKSFFIFSFFQETEGGQGLFSTEIKSSISYLYAPSGCKNLFSRDLSDDYNLIDPVDPRFELYPVSYKVYFNILREKRN